MYTEPNDCESDAAALAELSAGEMAKPPLVSPGSAPAAMPEQGAVDAANMVNEPEVAELSPPKAGLAKLAEEINARAPEVEEKSIELGNLLLKARDHFPKGKAGRAQWNAWYMTHIKLRESRVRQLMAIAKAPNPKTEQRRQKNLNKRRQKKLRNGRQQSAPLRNGANDDVEVPTLEPERVRLIAWAKKALLDDVKRMVAEIDKSDGDYPELPAFLKRSATKASPAGANPAATSTTATGNADNDNIETVADNPEQPTMRPEITPALEAAS